EHVEMLELASYPLCARPHVVEIGEVQRHNLGRRIRGDGLDCVKRYGGLLWVAAAHEHPRTSRREPLCRTQPESAARTRDEDGSARLVGDVIDRPFRHGPIIPPLRPSTRGRA